jgi:hypothetical protein
LDNIPDLPVVITAPPGLITQWAEELYRYLRVGSCSVLPYDVPDESRDTFWTNVYANANTDPGQRIIITSNSVSLLTPVQIRTLRVADYTACSKRLTKDLTLDVNFQLRNTLTKYTLKSQGASEVSLFGRKFSLAVYDEAHLARVKYGRIYHALRMLSGLSHGVVALTATPVITSPTDVWNLGRLLRAEGFRTAADENVADELFRQLGRETRRANREAKERRLEEGEEQTLVLRRAIAKQQETEGEVDSREASPMSQEDDGPARAKGVVIGPVPRLLHEQGIILRERLQEICIRRTQQSVDFAGNNIMQVEMYREHDMRVRLHPREQQVMDNILTVEDGVIGGRVKDSNVCVSYSTGRLVWLIIFTHRTFI